VVVERRKPKSGDKSPHSKGAISACGVRLCFDLPDGEDHRTPGADGVIGLKVTDVDAALTALQDRGVDAVAGPFDDHHGRWVKLIDPDGRSVVLTEQG